MNDIGIKIPEILLPKNDVNYHKWSVVACDQYTSQPKYWDEVKGIVGDEPSTYNIVFPEVYLKNSDTDERIRKINLKMKEYLSGNMFKKPIKGFIYVERQTAFNKLRKGLILAVDLEKYDYNEGSQSLIRATEGTVIDRLPPRIKIRKNAALEVPHVMVLIDDPEKKVIEPLKDEIGNMEKLYDFDLMMGGGHLKGYGITDDTVINRILKSLQKLAGPEFFKNRYNAGEEKGVLLFAVGDGNHSLAAAKAHWENIKKDLSYNERETHPARFSIVEVVNIHDEGLQFEPIHRVVFNADINDLFENMRNYFKSGGSNIKVEKDEKFKDTLDKLNEGTNQAVGYYTIRDAGTINIENPKHTLAVGSLQMFLDEYKKFHDIDVDYVHGEKALTDLCHKEGNIGFYLPAINKNDFFRTIIKDGVMPRKTFSMGEADDKRYYMESRKITK